MKIYIYTILVISSFFMFRCSDMNDVHSEYLKDGERIYIGKLDSLVVLPGDGRAILRFWASDPRAKSVMFNWIPEDDSLYFEFDRSTPRDTFEVVIGRENGMKPLAEGNYTLQATTSDNLGHFSLILEKSLSIYGDKYRSTLIDRVINSSQYESKENKLKLEFSGPFTDDDIGVEVMYTSEEMGIKTVQFADSLLLDPVTISNFDVSKGMKYRTMYLPDSLAIDTFYTAYLPVEITTTVNVGLNKPATASGVHGTNSPDRAVDGGLFDNDSRWVSPASGIHWLEIDLEEDYTIDGYKTWSGTNGNLSHEIPHFLFQVWIDGEWVTVDEVNNNNDPEYGASFPEVTTSKVRYYVPDYSGNRVRLYELEVYSTIKY